MFFIKKLTHAIEQCEDKPNRIKRPKEQVILTSNNIYTTSKWWNHVC